MHLWTLHRQVGTRVRTEVWTTQQGSFETRFWSILRKKNAFFLAPALLSTASSLIFQQAGWRTLISLTLSWFADWVLRLWHNGRGPMTFLTRWNPPRAASSSLFYLFHTPKKRRSHHDRRHITKFADDSVIIILWAGGNQKHFILAT